MKVKFLSIILTLCILTSLFTVNGFAATEFRVITFRDVPVMFASGMDVSYFVPATTDANRGYDYFWMIEKYTTNGELAGAYWSDSMDNLALRFYQMLDTTITANDISPLKTAFGTSFDGNYMYIYYGIVMLNNGYAFADNLGIRYFLTDGTSQTFVQENSSGNDYAYVAYNMPELGDVNCDSAVDTSDALYILQCIVGEVECTTSQMLLADVDGTGDVTSSDALTVLQMLVGKISVFPAVQQLV